MTAEPPSAPPDSSQAAAQRLVLAEDALIRSAPRRVSAEEQRKAARNAVEAGELKAALALLRPLLEALPGDHRGWSMLGIALRQAGRLEAAAVAQRRACLLHPAEGHYWSNLGNVLKDLDRLDESLEAHRRAVSLNAEEAGWRHNYAVALREAGQYEAALREFEVAIRLAPHNETLRWDRAMVLLHLGLWEEGWSAYEWRYRLAEMKPKPAGLPRWLGEDFQGKTLVLRPEQGFGDTLFALRWLPLVKARGGRVVLLAKPPLLRLLQGVPGADAVLPLDQPPPDAAFHASLMDLPRLFAASAETAPPCPRLAIPAEADVKAAAWLKPAAGLFTVGVVWSGSVTFRNNAKRAVAVERFLPLGEMPGVQLVSLQKGPREPDLESSGAGAVMLELGSRVTDFAETAAVIRRLDLVIMTDSSVAHLCGVLGRPVWNLLNFVPYWLYGEAGEATPWYPSMRLFRQPRPADWDSVFAVLRNELTKAVEAKRDGRWPQGPVRQGPVS